MDQLLLYIAIGGLSITIGVLGFQLGYVTGNKAARDEMFRNTRGF